MSGPARSRDHRREALRRAVNLIYEFLRAPPQRPSGDVCFLLTSTYMDVGNSEVNDSPRGSSSQLTVSPLYEQSA
jgi:hypothetical protein